MKIAINEAQQWSGAIRERCLFGGALHGEHLCTSLSLALYLEWLHILLAARGDSIRRST
jgi:hypothetical protein